jgi:murein DD-endopeptidase MepM/ murein hydrolase activator NlpD
MRTFLLKAKHFFRRNIYPITVTFCTVLILGVITISAYASIKESNQELAQTNNPIVSENEPVQKEDDKTTEMGGSTAKPDADATKPVVQQIVFSKPFDNAVISKDYADSSLVYDATTKLWCTHQGIDFSAIEGQDVKSVYDGVISKVESTMMYGTIVYLKVSDEITVVFKGLASNVQVKEGDNVKKGQIIGKVTSFLAEKAEGIHLHLEVLKAGKFINPNEYFKK